MLLSKMSVKFDGFFLSAATFLHKMNVREMNTKKKREREKKHLNSFKCLLNI